MVIDENLLAAISQVGGGDTVCKTGEGRYLCGNANVRKFPMTNETIVTAAMLAIGDELLSGRTKDKNIGHLADMLTLSGIDLKEVRIVADEEDAIVEALNALRGRYDYVFTSGGIGRAIRRATGREPLGRARGRDGIPAPAGSRGSGPA